MDESIAAWAASPRPRVAARAARTRTGLLVLIACLGLHLVFFAWLYHATPQLERPPAMAAAPLQVHWIPSSDLPSPPPMPRKRRSAPPDPARRSPSRATDTPVSAPRSVSAPALAVPAPLPRPRRLGDQLGELDLLPPGEARYGRHDPMNPMRARLPSSDVRIVGNFTLRREITPADVVNAVGGFLFGGNYDPCPDIRGKLHQATVLAPDRYDDAQRRDLVERERRCRYR